MKLVEFNQNDLLILVRIVVSIVLSGALGWERERKGRDAGLRTHILVGMSSTLFVSLGTPIVAAYVEDAAAHGAPLPSTDPLRLLGAVVSGISFLGAGTIFVSRRRDHVEGLTTAASLLATCAIGTTVGVDRHVLAVAVTAIVLGVLFFLRRFEPGKRGSGDANAGKTPTS